MGKRQKSYYRKCAKKQKFSNDNILSPGMSGFIATCNDREKQCVREAYNLLNKYADKLYGKEVMENQINENKDSSGMLIFYKLSCYLVYLASKLSMTIRHCFQHADLVSHCSFYISSNTSVSLINLMIFSTSQLFSNRTLKSPWIFC